MAETQGQTILIVEDEKALRGLLTQKMRDAGYEVIEAGDGAEGLEFALRKHPAVIVLDIMMPGTDGLSMLQQLRKNIPYGAQVPVIMLTNLTPDSNQIIKAIEVYEPVFYLVKADTTPVVVVDKIREALGKG